MSTTQDLISVAVDCYKGRPCGNYSLDQAMDSVYNGLIAANNGKNYLDIRDIRDGKCAGLFSIIEQLITKTAIEGLQGDEFFMTLVDYINMANGDKPEFYTPDDSLFDVATIARGTQGVRRQRLNGGTKVTVDTKSYSVKIFEHLDRVLSKRVDFVDMINKVGQSFAEKEYEDIYNTWSSLITANGSTYFPTAGSWDEETFLELCAHVEANGVKPIILGTPAALRKVKTADISDSAKEDKYNIGYYGKVDGYDMVSVKNRHRVNTDDFIFPDDKLYIIGTTTKPIKYVNEGESLIIITNPEQNADLTQEYFITNRAGCAIVLPDKQIGVYTIS
ncbi:MAG: hypothetical protein NC244_07775 [Alistipes senegalensis]|nr:hypothetical protein [Alistipes senegalensis]